MSALSIAPPVPPATQDEPEREPTLRGPLLAALATIGIAFGGFLGWSFLAALDSAAVAPGVIIVDSHRKTVQHLEGGILRELLVREGDRVVAGQVLLRLDSTQAEAQLGQLVNQYWTARAREARLLTERNERRSFTFAEDMLAAAARDPALADILQTEQRLFQSRWETFDGMVAVIRQRIAVTREQMVALRLQETSKTQQLRYVEDELGGVRQLVARGYERRPRLLDLERRAAELQGDRGDLRSRLAQAEQTIAGAELEIIGQQNTRSTDIFNQLQQTQASLADLGERLRGARHIVQRTEVTAPQGGLVTNLHYFTPGGVIAAGQPILDIVPQDDELVVEAMVEPKDIHSVRAGLPANVRLTAYKQRLVPVVAGTVITVSADALADQRTGQSYFSTRVRLSQESLHEIDRVSLYPGMPAEVLITTGERRAIDYFLSPLTDIMQRALREE